MTEPRDPRAPFPTGWFHVIPSADLAPGAVVEQIFQGEPVVVFRTESGVAAVAGAHCPHLGAHLGRGGRVEGETLRCPYHGLRWATDGRCAATGYPGDPAYPERLQVHPTVERYGFVFAWHDRRGRGPGWQLPELDTDGWTEPLCTRVPMRAHPESVCENGVDTEHFKNVHGFGLEGGVFEDRGETFHCEFHFESRNHFRTGPERITTFFDTDNYGLGLAISVNRCDELGIQYRVFVMPTPTDEGHIDYALGTSLRLPAQGDQVAGHPSEKVAELMHRGAVGGSLQDQPIWESMRYVAQPKLVRGDGPIPKFRAWARQFYPS